MFPRRAKVGVKSQERQRYPPQPPAATLGACLDDSLGAEDRDEEDNLVFRGVLPAHTGGLPRTLLASWVFLQTVHTIFSFRKVF